MQRFGRAVRDLTLQGIAILIVESIWFYDEQLRLEAKRKKRERNILRTQNGKDLPPACKRLRAEPSGGTRPLSSTHESPQQTSNNVLLTSSRVNGPFSGVGPTSHPAPVNGPFNASFLISHPASASSSGRYSHGPFSDEVSAPART